MSTPPVSAQRKNSDTFKVLFIGNSHLFNYEVPERVQKQLQSIKGSVEIQTFAHSGAQLLGHTQNADVVSAIETVSWDVIVIQEASATFLTAQGLERFRKAVDWFVRKIPEETRIVVYQTWPWRADSRYFKGYTTDASEMWTNMKTEHDKITEISRINIAPVGACWVRSPQRAAFYSSDGNHASVEGASFAADVITRAITGADHDGCS